MASFLRWALVLLLAPFLSGCSDSIATVQGVVTLDDQPLDKGDVVFNPVGGGPAAYGSIRPGGQFTLATGDAAGLKPGDYVATVSVQTIPADGSGEMAKSLAPAKYATADKSDLKVTVRLGRNPVTLKLTSK